MHSPNELTKKPLILIVDDAPANVCLLSLMLTHNHYEICTASNGVMALELLQGDGPKPDLMLLDINMPHLDGYQLCEQIQTMPEIASIPVIFISALGNVNDKVKGFKVGAVDYVGKPFAVDEVLMRVRTHLTINQQRQELERQNKLLIMEVEKRQAAEAKLQQLNQELKHLSITDGLTKVYNRRYFDHHFQREWNRLVREQGPLSLALGDVDYFKKYNDRYGHPAGDRCLQSLVQCMQRGLKRAIDFVGRYGGEEFVLLLPNTDLDGAIHVLTQVQKEIVALQLPHEGSLVAPHVTMSFGLVSTVPQGLDSQDEFLKAADIALYEAKEQGRNRVVSQIFEAPEM